MIDDVRDALKELEKMPILRRGRSKASPSKYPANSIFAIADNKKWFQSVVRRSSINKFRWHDLRHTFISRLVQVRVNLKVVQEAAGQRNIAMTARYAHLNKTTVAEAMALLNRKKNKMKKAG